MEYIPTRRKFKGPILAERGFEVGPRDNPTLVIDEKGNFIGLPDSNIQEGSPSVSAAATNTLTFSGPVNAGEGIEIGDKKYEYNFSTATLADGVILIDIDLAPNVAAYGSLTFSGVPVDGDTIQIGKDIYEFDDDDSVEAGNIPVGIAGITDIADAITALVTDSLSGTEDITLIAGIENDADKVFINSVGLGVLGNEIGVAVDSEVIAASGETLVGGADCFQEFAIDNLLSALGTHPDVTAAKGAELEANIITITAKVAGIEGNSIALVSRCENAEFGGSTLSGGFDPMEGKKGQMMFDNSYLYICVDIVNDKAVWKKVAFS